VPGNRDGIGAQRSHIERDPSSSLDGVAVEKDASGVGNLGESGHVLERTQLVIDQRNSCHSGPACATSAQCLRIDLTAGADWHHHHIEALANERLSGAVHRWVLDRRDQQPLGFAGRHGDASECNEAQIVGLGTSTGENQVISLGTDDAGQLATGYLNALTRLPTFEVNAGRISGSPTENGDHGLLGTWVKRCRRIVVQINTMIAVI